VKRILIVFTRNALTGQTVNESLTASLVMATYGLPVQLCFQGDAISLLDTPSAGSEQPFKTTYGIIESLEFYDVLPVWVWPDQHTNLTMLANSNIEHEIVNLTPELINQFDQILYW
jgi:sulfur relay (sulfurtransferase) DsrF/TusC family protein